MTAGKEGYESKRKPKLSIVQTGLEGGASVPLTAEISSAAIASTTSKATKPRSRSPVGGSHKGGEKSPTLPPSSGGGGFSGWWEERDIFTRVAALVFLLATVIILLYGLTIFVGRWMDKAQNERILDEARTKAEEARILQTIKPVRLQELPAVEAQSFNCSTEELLQQGFAENGTVEGPQGRPLIIKNGCAWVRFESDVISLDGHGYVITFDPPNVTNPDMCGSGKAGRNDSPTSCIDFINNRKGERFRAVIDGGGAYIKLKGGKS